MPLNWETGFANASITSVGIMGSANLIYANQRETVNQITLVQKCVVIATHFMCLTDTTDLMRLRLSVVDEAVTPTVSEPEDQDKRIKGLYPFAMGPVYFSPRRKIDVPSEQDLFLVIEKVAGGNATIVTVHWRFLLYTSLG